jgi:hypothetical protein
MKTRLQRVVLGGLGLLLAAVLLAGCQNAGALPDEVKSNDVLTYQALDANKMTITLRAEYNVKNEAILKALQAKFPEVNLVSVFHCSQETQYELRQSLTGDTDADIVISPNMQSISDIAPDTLMDLTAGDFVTNYTGSSIEDCQLNGRIYYLPGPSSLYGIVYDKTLFQQMGWQVPQSYDAFISLVGTINATGIRAIQPTCKYARQAQMVFTMFDYGDVFGGVDNTGWLKAYQQGSTTMTGHVEPALTRYSQLHDAGVIQASDFDVQPGNRSTMLYTNHTCAMIIENEQAELYAAQAGSDHQYGMFPFWCGNTADSDYLMSIPSYYVGVSKRMAENSNAQKRAKIEEILRYISTPEGQEAINGGAMTQISNVTGTPYASTDFNAGIQSTIQKGNAVSEVSLMASGNNNAVEKALQKDLKKYLEGTMDAAALTADCDAVRDKALQAGIDRGAYVGKASADMTPMETGLFIADALKQKADADIGLCLVGTTHCGMVGRIYKGDIYEADVNSLSLSVGTTSSDPNDKKLWLVSMTGKDLKDLLETAAAYDPKDNVPNIPYYVASGLKITFAPWAQDKIQSVTLADGSALDDSATYRVALWGWPFKTACPGTVEKVFPDTSTAILSEAIAGQGTVTPFTDGRFELVYSQTQ